MVQQVVNVGTQANDATGDLLRDAFTKINNNFAVFFTGNFPTAQMTIGPPISGTALSVIGLAGQNAISTTIGTVNFAAPTSGNTLTSTGVTGSAAVVATAASVTDISLTASGTASFAGGVTFGLPTGGNKGAGSFNAVTGFINNVAIFAGTPVTTFTSNTGLSTNVAATGAVTVTNTGVLSLAGTANQIAASASTGAITLTLPQNVIIPTPTSGVALSVVGGTASTAVTITAGTGQRAQIINGVDNGFTSAIFASTTAGASFGLQIRSGTNASDLCISANNAANTAAYLSIAGDGSGTLGPSASLGISWTSAGRVILPAPSSGDLLTLTNVAGANALTIAGNSAGTAVLRLNTQATTGAQTATFAASNKPGSGTTSPDKWIPINLDGTLHYVPAFL